MKKFFREFKEFAIKGNMMTMAVGIIIGSAFTAIVNSLVGDIVMPLITIITGKVDVSQVFFTIGNTQIYYGKFLQAIIVFLITAFAVFLLVKSINKMTSIGKKKKEEEAPAPEEPPKPTTEELLEKIVEILEKK